MTKMTYAQAIENAIKALEICESGEFERNVTIEKLDALKVQLAKRGSGKRGMTKTQKENEVLMETIVVALAEIDKPVTVTELIANGEGLDGYTNQKISALLRKLVEAGKVVKTIEKKKAYFSVA